MPGQRYRTQLLAVPVVLVLLAGSVAGQDKAGAEPKYETERDILYRESGELPDAIRDRCRLDLYYPRGPAGFATVVWFHGGGLTSGEKSIPAALQGKGIAIAAANYRLSPAAKAPAYVEDAAAAVAWVLKNVERYGGSPQRVFVSGHSAGGYLTSMVGLDERWLAAHGVDRNEIAGLAPFSGQCATHSAIRAERGIGETRPLIDDLAPLYHVRKDAPPLLLVTGDREKELRGRYEENAYFRRMLSVAGHEDVQLYELQGYDHGGMAEPAFPLLLRFIDQRPESVRPE